jgi:type IV secretory pathway TraG/TraD family ATPase VirD4
MGIFSRSVRNASICGPCTDLGAGFNLADRTRILDISIPDRDRARHTFVFGTTGVGKTRLAEYLIEQDIRKGYSVAFFDPKGDQEIFAKIVDVAEQCGRLNELMLVTPIYPEYSAIIDPMAYYFMVDELVGHVVSGIKGGKEPFFRNIAKDITLAAILSIRLIAEAQKKKPLLNFNELRKGIRRSTLKEYREALLTIATAEAEEVAGMIQDVLESPQEYYAKVSSSLRTALVELSSGNIGRVIGKADENRFIKRLEQGKRVILAVHSGSLITREAAATLCKVIISIIQSFIGRTYLSNRRRVTPPLSIYLDESQSLLYQGIEELFAKAGSAGVMVNAFAQSVNQLYAAVGEEFAKSILDNTNTKLFMRCPDAETSAYATEHFGVHKVLAPIMQPTGGITAREVEEDVLRVSDILDLGQQEFYLRTYSGRYRGRIRDVSPSRLKIKFPDAPAGVAIPAGQGAGAGEES